MIDGYLNKKLSKMWKEMTRIQEIKTFSGDLSEYYVWYVVMTNRRSK